jgi:sulfonate transport system substrate-binding protein
LLIGGVAVLGLAGCARRRASPRPILKIGDQRGGVHALMTAAGTLEGAPYDVDWIDMPAAAPLLESLSAGAVDLGSVGGAPFAFAYANGAKVKAVLAARIVNADPAAGKSAAILVPGRSPLRTVADLRGRKLSTVKGSAGHETALRIFEHAGIDPKSVQFVFLNNGDSKAALGSGASTPGRPGEPMSVSPWRRMATGCSPTPVPWSGRGGCRASRWPATRRCARNAR